MIPSPRRYLFWGLTLGILLCLLAAGGFHLAGYQLHRGAQMAPSGTQEAPKTQLYRCPMHPEIVRKEPGKCPICGMDLVPVPSTGVPAAPAVKKEAKVQLYRCPMHPEIVRKEPGKCPLCGMDLVPVREEAGAAETPGAIAVSPATVQSMGVLTAKVEKKPLSRVTVAVGLVTYNERHLATITTKVNGWVERLYVNATGDTVRRGQTLLAIYSPELVSAQEEYLLAWKNYRTMAQSPVQEMAQGAQRLLAASRRRLSYFDISSRQIETLKRTGKVKKNLVLASPANGIVTKRMVTQGMYVQMNMPLLEVADLSTVWVDAQIYQYELPWIKVGQPVTMSLEYLPGESFPGAIDYIYPYLKGATRTAKVRLKFPNPKLKLKPEMFAQVKIESPVSKAAVVVPSQAVFDTGLKQHVFLALGQGRFQPREVKLGVEGNDGLREVLSGLQGGEDVVISAQFLLDSESRFRQAVQMMLPTAADGKKEGDKEAAPAAKSQAPALMPPGHKH
ncbi:MAG: efflux RND transporter periplasmic adaptor subunit [Thermodesulfobacteriota bacterium]